MQFAILISVLVALILGAFLLLTHVHSFFKIKNEELVQTIEDTNTELFKAMDEGLSSNDTLISVLSSAKTMRQTAHYYGGWYKRYIALDVNNRKVVKTAFTGSKRTPKTPNLYLENNNSPLVVVGNTRLEGNSYLPKQGLKAGNISGTYYQGNTLYYGATLESTTALPDVDPAWLVYLQNISQGSLLESTTVISLEKELKNSFKTKAQIIYNDAPIFLGDQKISGHIIVQSNSRIVVGSAAQLTDVLLIAPEIRIESQVKGSFQAIATKNIHISKNVYLQYPSALILLDKNIDQGTRANSAKVVPHFIIDSGTIIEGTVAYLTNEKTRTQKNRTKTQLEIATNVEVIGEIYCYGNIDFQGMVRGSLYARQCIARQKGSVYLNHLYNAQVLRNPIVDYAGLPFEKTTHTIAQWLY